MNLKNINCAHVLITLALGLTMTACQKMDRPELGEPVLDPPPPPYSILKNFFEFEDNAGDSGQFRMTTKAEAVSFAEGIKGKGVKIDPGGYVVMAAVNDSLKTPGDLTLSFWMNGVGPVQGGAQGVFALSNSAEFWGNFEIFLENHNNGNEGFLKIHMFNTSAADGKGEEWAEAKIPNLLGKWSHVAITYNSATSQLNTYADGELVPDASKVLGGGNYGALKFANVNGLVIGSFAFQTDPSLTNHGPEDWAKSFNGVMDQFRIYNVALSEAEVKNLFNNKE